MNEWKVELWDVDGSGLRISVDAECGDHVEFGLVMTKARANDGGLMEKVTHGDSSARVNVEILDPECPVYLFGGLVKRDGLTRYLRMVLALLEAEA